MAIFNEQVSRPIGKADMEFFESGLVLKMALILSDCTEEEWNALSYRPRNRWLNRATEAVCRLFNDADVASHLLPLAKNLAQRI